MFLNLTKVECLEYTKNECTILKEIERLTKEKVILCPDCGSKVYIHSHYLRRVIYSEFETVKVKIIKIKCTNASCAKIHAILPDFILPKKQYSKQIIQQALIGTANSNCPADNSTILRWKKSVMSSLQY